MCDWWVSRWAGHVLVHISDRTYTIVYFGLFIAFTILLFLRNTVFTWSMVRASTQLHNAMFGKVLHAPMSFFW